MKTRLQALGLLDRAIAAMTDEELDTLVAALDDDHREAVERLATGTSAAEIREAVAHGRINGTMESLAMVLSDHCLADCIEQLGDHADNPSTAQLQEALPGVAERHGVPITRVMLASTVAGEAPASAIIRDLLKHDDLVKLPPAEPRAIVPAAAATTSEPDPEREAMLEKRREAKQRKRDEARLRREQSAKDRGRV